MQVELEEKFKPSPWPTDSEQRVIFILDARNHFEQNILEQWVARHTAGPRSEPT